MTKFGDQLRAQMLGSKSAGEAAALADAGSWVEEHITQKLEEKMARLAETGKDTLQLTHPFLHKLYFRVDDIEALPQFQHLKERCHMLGLDMITLCHKKLEGRSESEYPQVEVRIKIPPAWKLAAGGAPVSPW